MAAVGAERIKCNKSEPCGMNVVGQIIETRGSPFSATLGIRIQGHFRVQEMLRS